MDEQLKNLIQQIVARAQSRPGDYGIGLAASYVKHLAVCADDPVCAARFGVDAQDWTKGLALTAGVLAYSNDEMISFGGYQADAANEVKRTWGKNFDEKDWDATQLSLALKASKREVTPLSCMEFDGVITSSKQDRDNDILDSAGADLDERMPLLAQHMPMLPIGKFVSAGPRSTKRVTGRFAIADTPLGNDYAFLAEFGALRISHGFKPVKWEPLEKEKNDDRPGPAGWHIHEFKVMETSLVSVPANEDAIILALSRSKLHHAFTKAWGMALWEKQPKAVKSGWNPDVGPAPPLKCACGTHNPAKTPEPSPPPPAPAPAKAADTSPVNLVAIKARKVKVSAKRAAEIGYDQSAKLLQERGVALQLAGIPESVRAAAEKWAKRSLAKWIETYGRSSGQYIGGLGLAAAKLAGTEAKLVLVPFAAVSKVFGGQATTTGAFEDTNWRDAAKHVEKAWKKALKRWDEIVSDKGFLESEHGEVVGGSRFWSRRTGRVTVKGRFGAADGGKLKDAYDHLQGAAGVDGVPKMCKTLIGRASATCKSLCDKHGQPDPGIDNKPNPGGTGPNPETAAKPAVKGKVTKGDLRKLADAIDHAQTAQEHDAMPPPARTLCAAACSSMKDVHAKHAKAKAKAKQSAAQFLGHLLTGKGVSVPVEVLQHIRDEIDSDLERRANDQLAELLP